MPRPLALTLVALVLAAALGACSGGVSVKPDAPTGINLAGTWRLNRQASQDPHAMLAKIREDQMKRMRREYMRSMDPEELPDIDPNGNPTMPRREPPRGGGEQRGGDDEHGPGGRRGRQMRMPYEEALGAALTSDFLKIEQSATRFTLTRGDDRRSFTPGADSVVSVAEGVADQTSGWAGREYVIEVRPQVGPRVVQRYGLSPDGHQLVEKYTLTEQGWPKLEFTRVYDAGAASPRAMPTSN